jgi:hypothetical protein
MNKNSIFKIPALDTPKNYNQCVYCNIPLANYACEKCGWAIPFPAVVIAEASKSNYLDAGGLEVYYGGMRGSEMSPSEVHLLATMLAEAPHIHNLLNQLVLQVKTKSVVEEMRSNAEESPVQSLEEARVD